MGKIDLTEEDLRILSECINNQTETPEDLLTKLSPGFFDKLRQAGKFDYKELDKYKVPTIEYAGKRPESVILAQAAITGGAAPLQVVRSFGNPTNGEWRNMIVQGDNLQFLKTCYMNQDPLIKDKVKGKVKLIYIDPPFGTKSDFGSSGGVKSYADKIDSAEYIESLRERLIYMRELLSPDGGIYVHLDQKMGHYLKAILDEIFDTSNFRNEIIWQRTRAQHTDSKSFGNIHDNIFIYSRTMNCSFLPQYVPHKPEYLKRFNKVDGNGRKYMLIPAHAAGQGPARIFFGKKINPPKGRHWAYTQEKIDELIKQDKIELTSTGMPNVRQYLDESKGAVAQSLWIDIIPLNPVAAERVDFPTQKPESLLERIINSSTKETDLVVDVFAGSGTTAAVAEKLGRRWIMCDFGKHAIYVMQKRILNISSSKKLDSDKKKNEKYKKPPMPFCIVSAGAYDFSRIMNLRKNKDAYISFVLGLFSIMRDDTDYSKKYKLSNIYAEKDGHPVEIFPVWEDEYLKNVRIDKDYLKDIISASGGKLKGNYYIVTPETCTVISDTTLKNSNKENVNFKLLKFPYKVLEDVSRQFQIEEQPASQDDINRLISSVGFYFNEDVKIAVGCIGGGFKITKFDTGILNKDKERFKGLDGLSMILIDNDYDGKVFDMDIAIYAKEINEDGVVKVEGLTKNSNLIAIDRHGNESKVIKIG